MPAIDAIQAAAIPFVERQREVIHEGLIVVGSEEVGDLLIRPDRVVLARQQDRVIERHASPEDLGDAFESGPNVTKTAVVAAMLLEEDDVGERSQQGHHPAIRCVIGLPVDVDEEVGTLGIEPGYESG
jgi:hypothetical protein